MTLKAFNDCFKVIFKLYDHLKADYELVIGNKENSLLFFNAFSSEHWNVLFQQQKQHHKMTIDEFLEFFQICHSTDHPIRKQCRCKAAEKFEWKEANQEKDIDDKECSAACWKTAWDMTMKISPNMPNMKIFVTFVLAMDMTCCGKSVPVKTGTTKTIISLRFLLLTALKAEPLKTASCLWWSNCHCSCSRSFSCDCHDCRECDHRSAASDCRDKNYHA